MLFFHISIPIYTKSVGEAMFSSPGAELKPIILLILHLGSYIPANYCELNQRLII